MAGVKKGRGRGNFILGDPGAVSRAERKGATKVFKHRAWTTFVAPFLSFRLTAPGSPRMRCRCIFILFFHIRIFFWLNFRYLAELFYWKKLENPVILPNYSCKCCFSNRWNQESAGRVYFNISREKPAHTPATPHVQPLSCKLEWTNQKHFYCFFT